MVAAPYVLAAAPDTAAVARPRQYTGRTMLLEPLAQQLTIQAFCKTTYRPVLGHSTQMSAHRTLKPMMSASRTTWTCSSTAVPCARTVGGAALSGSTHGQLADRGRHP